VRLPNISDVSIPTDLSDRIKPLPYSITGNGVMDGLRGSSKCALGVRLKLALTFVLRS